MIGDLYQWWCWGGKEERDSRDFRKIKRAELGAGRNEEGKEGEGMMLVVLAQERQRTQEVGRVVGKVDATFHPIHAVRNAGETPAYR